jgi:predicted porin
MNKKLVAVAVAGLLGAPLAAQAQTANVTLYGRLNVNFEAVNGAQTPDVNGHQSNPLVTRLSSNSSRFGIRGIESLGGGLSAIFQIESSINGDTNSGNLGGRETFVGFQGGWGTFKVGQFLMPLDDMHPIFGNVPTYLTSILSTADLWTQGTYNKFDGGFDERLGNSLRYDSPSFSGLTFSGQISLRDSSGTAGEGNFGSHAAELRHAYVLGGNAIYNNGPIQIGAAFETNQKVRAPGLNDTDLTLTGGYNFGVIRVAGLYEYLKYDTPTGDLKRNMWGVSGTMPMGPGTWYAFYGRAGDGRGSALNGTRVGGLTRGSDTGSSQWELSYTYPFSKRTQVYAGYVKLDNDRNAAYTFNINAYTANTSCTTSQATCGENGKPGGFVLGMIHLF